MGEEIKNDINSYRRYLLGDNGALQSIVQEYRAGLILYSETLVHNITDAEDLAEDVFAELIFKRPEFDGRSSLKTWLYAIARHKCLNHLKRSKRIEVVSNEKITSIADNDPMASFRYYEEEAFDDEKLKALHSKLEKLHDEYRQVVYLYYFENMSTEEIAKVMKKSKKQVGNLMYRAKAALYKMLKDEEINI